MSKLTPIEAFTSDDGKRGRVWRGEWMDGNAYFKRIDDDLWIMEDPSGPMRICDEQVAAMSGECRWADEPKTLTPAEALRALALGAVLQDEDVTVRVGDDGTFRGPDERGVDGPVTIHRLGGFRLVPDPSQPADYVHAGKPITKVRDDMRDFDYGPLWPEHAHTELPSERQPAEPQVEHNSYCDRAGAYPRSHPCVRCQSDYLKRKQQEGK